jgi:DinB superfamily
MDTTDERSALLEAFASFPSRLAAAARARAAEWRPIPAGEWGPNETVRHLIAVEEGVWRSRLARVAAEDDPHWAWTEPGLAPGFDGASLLEILSAFARARARTVAAVRALDDDGWARFGTHETYGVLDVAGLLRLANDHGEEHLEGLRQPRAS